MRGFSVIALSIVFFSVFGAFTTIAKTIDDIDFLLIPYQKVLDNLSKEFGITFYVEDENKEKLYNNVKDMTPKKFEQSLRDQFKEAQQYMHDSSYDNGEDASFGPKNIPNAQEVLPTTPLK
ncbi:hypothetical protein ACIQ4I_01580 [Rummeliibacillus sp. NPDC094406]|uniref:hypothetical protein n=1 Tax=Rummeliibacillus sp. NPDC094406 TaxID=3364511 RepID=UPI0038191CC2